MKLSASYLCFSLTLLLAYVGSTFAQDNGDLADWFNAIAWKRDNSNSFEYDQENCTGNSPAGRNGYIQKLKGVYRFTVKNQPKKKCRQELKYERRKYTHSMVGAFTFWGADFSGDVAVAQTHDDATGSSGVSSIYKIYKSGNKYYLRPQSDKDGDGSSWTPVEIKESNWYFVDIQTYSDGSDSFERARVWNGHTKSSMGNTPIAEWWIDDGSGDFDSSTATQEQYKKIGAYLLTGAKGSVTVEWRNVETWASQDALDHAD